MWIARDKDRQLTLFLDEPIREDDKGRFVVSVDTNKDDYIDMSPAMWDNMEYMYLPSFMFPECTWDNSPIELQTRVSIPNSLPESKELTIIPNMAESLVSLMWAQGYDEVSRTVHPEGSIVVEKYKILFKKRS